MNYKGSQKYRGNAPRYFGFNRQRLSDSLVDYLTSAIKSALGANVMIHNGCTAVGTGCQLRNDSLVVGSSFISALLGDFSFRMCHCKLFLIVFAFQQLLKVTERGFCSGPRNTQILLDVGIALSLRMDFHNRQGEADIVVNELVKTQLALSGIHQHDILLRPGLIHVHSPEPYCQLPLEIHFQHQILKTTVTLRHHEPAHKTIDFQYSLLTDDIGPDSAPCIQYLGISITLKELSIYLKPERMTPLLQPPYGNYDLVKHRSYTFAKWAANIQIFINKRKIMPIFARMRIDILSVVPELLESPLNHSIVKRSQDKGLAEIHVHNIRDYGLGRYRQVDDYSFGGDAGMVMMIEPVYNIISKLKQERQYDEVIYTSPDGEILSQGIANELSLKENLIILCGHYKGIDHRIREHLVTREISVGDYVLSGGEIPAAIITDAIVRLIPGVLGDEQSALSDSFQDGLLAPPVYTRPAEFNGWKVPEVLMSGDPKKISQWQEAQAIERTRALRPHLLDE